MVFTLQCSDGFAGRPWSMWLKKGAHLLFAELTGSNLLACFLTESAGEEEYWK